MLKQIITSDADAERPSDADASVDSATPIGFLFQWNAEITRFYLSRYQQYGVLPFRLLSCRTAHEIEALRAEFEHELLEDYRHEAERLSALVGAGAQISEAPAEAGHAEQLLQAQQDAAAIIAQAKQQAERILASARERAAPPAAATEVPMKKHG